MPRPAAPRRWPGDEVPGITSDAYHMVAPAPDGLRPVRAMKRAMETAGLTAADIDHVNAHGTRHADR